MCRTVDRRFLQIQSHIPYSKKLWQWKNFGKFGELQLAFCHGFSQIFTSSITYVCKWTSIRQSFFCQISYSPYLPNLFTAKVFNCTVANLKWFKWFYCITKITMIVKYLIVVVRPIWQHKFGNNRKLYKWIKNNAGITGKLCDLAWENRAYAHVKFDHFFGLWSFITLCLNIVAILMKLLRVVLYTMGNVMQLTELVQLTQRVR